MGRLYIMEIAGVETHPKNTQLEIVNSRKKGGEKKKKETNIQALLLLEILCITTAEKQKLSLHSS